MKTAALAKETRQWAEVEKAKTNLATELAALRVQMEKAKIDRFDDCLKQVGFVYPDLDLFKITIDDIVSQTPRGDDIVNDMPDESTHTIEQEAKDDGVVIAQLEPEGPIAPAVSSVMDPSSDFVHTVALAVLNLTVLGASLS